MKAALLENPLIARVIKNSGYLFSATGITAVISMVQGILAARLLGVEGFGILGTITMFTSVVNKFASFRMGELVIKYVGQYTETEDTARASALFKAAAIAEMGASILAFILIWLLSPLAARYFGKDISLAHWFALYGLIVIANLIAESSTGLLQIFDRFRRMAALSVVQSLVTLAIITYVYIQQGGFAGVLAAYIAGKTIGALGLTIAAIIEATRRWGKGWWNTSLKVLRPQGRELAHFAISTNISASLSLINKDSELLWVSLLRNPLEAGYYKLALALANMAQMPVSPLPQATYPEISREVARKNWGNVRFILKRGSLLAGGYTLAISLGLLVLGRPLIRTLYTPEYLPAFPALLILLAGFLVANTFYWNRIALLAIGHPDFPAKVNMALAVMKVIGMLLLVPRFGFLASAALLAGSYLIGVTVSVIKFRLSLAKKEMV
ncbi:MAG: oligosaccharide flippase family protein [Anaerolineales bacterium]|nr:oligosaccharide flippase family protein [Anaerolineales bacterium]